jgi:hypothetical protein
VYVSTNDQTLDTGTLQIVETGNPSRAHLVHTAEITTLLFGLAVSGPFVYLPAGDTGLVVIDVRDPTAPGLHTVLDGVFPTSMQIVGDFGYLVEKRAGATYFTILDLHTPGTPQRRGAVRIRDVRQFDNPFPIAIAGQFASVVEFALGIQAIDIGHPGAPASSTASIPRVRL